MCLSARGVDPRHESHIEAVSMSLGLQSNVQSMKRRPALSAGPRIREELHRNDNWRHERNGIRDGDAPLASTIAFFRLLIAAWQGSSGQKS